MDLPDKAEQDKMFAAWEREFQEPPEVPQPKESRFRRLARLFFKLLDEEGRRIDREGLADEYRARYRRPAASNDNEEHDASA